MSLPNSPESWDLLISRLDHADFIKPLPGSMTVMHYLHNQQPIIDAQEWYRQQGKPISPLFIPKETHTMNQCEIDGCEHMIREKCNYEGWNDETWTQCGRKSCGYFHKKETKMIQEKDCRRCEKYDAEGYCNTPAGNKFVPAVENACLDNFTPVQGRDCRNCQRFSGQGKVCTGCESTAHTLTSGCPRHIPLQTSKPSPTVLTYTDEEESKFRVIKGDKTLSLENAWASRPCSDEYRNMSMRFTRAGFNPDTEIPFTQENLDLLSDSAFAWLLDGEFFIEAKEKEVEETFKIGDWFAERMSGALAILSLTQTRPGPHISMIPVEGSQPGRVWDSMSPVQVANTDKITWEDIEKLTGAKDWFRPTTPPEIKNT